MTKISTISISGATVFWPRNLEIEREDIVVWKSDFIRHILTSDEGLFQDQTIAANDTRSYKFDVPGIYTFRASCLVQDCGAGRGTAVQTITVVAPVPTTGDICLQSNPGGASIFIDSILQSKITAISGTGCVDNNIVTGLSVGPHSYTVSLAGYQNQSGTISITAGTTITIDVGGLTPISVPTTGDICLQSNPGGASIFIDSILQSKITAISGTGCVDNNIVTGLSVGPHSYTVSLAGYQNQSGTISITADTTTTVDTGTLVLIITDAEKQRRRTLVSNASNDYGWRGDLKNEATQRLSMWEAAHWGDVFFTPNTFNNYRISTEDAIKKEKEFRSSGQTYKGLLLEYSDLYYPEYVKSETDRIDQNDNISTSDQSKELANYQTIEANYLNQEQETTGIAGGISLLGLAILSLAIGKLLQKKKTMTK